MVSLKESTNSAINVYSKSKKRKFKSRKFRKSKSKRFKLDVLNDEEDDPTTTVANDDKDSMVNDQSVKASAGEIKVMDIAKDPVDKGNIVNIKTVDNTHIVRHRQGY